MSRSNSTRSTKSNFLADVPGPLISGFLRSGGHKTPRNQKLTEMNKWKLFFRSLPIVMIVLATKLVLTELVKFKGLMELSEIGLILTAGIFLVGLMLTGVLADYKESEKIPAELASSLESVEEALVYSARSKPAALNAVELKKELMALSLPIYDWFLKKVTTEKLLQSFTGFNDTIQKLEQAGIPPNMVIKAMSDVQNARKTLLRVHVISRTNFISAGYSLLELVLTLIMVLLMITLFKGVTSEIIIVFSISLVNTYMYLLIKDIDDPFEYDQNGVLHGTEIALFPLTEYLERANSRLEAI